MTPANKDSESKSLFWKVWILHYCIYYWTFWTIFSVGAMICGGHFTGGILQIIAAPLIAITGLYDCMVIVLPLLVYSLFRMKFDIFKSYIFTIVLNYSVLIGYFSLTDGKYFFSYREECSERYNPAVVIIPCLIFSIIINYFIFRKKYKKIGISYIW